jgi:hypothetical protein
VLAALGLYCFSLKTASGADKKRRQGQVSYALIAGTVFQRSGFSLPGAEVIVSAAPEERQKAKRKFKPVSYVADDRGEFAVRVPPVPASYIVTARAPGFQQQEKRVIVSGDERVDLFFRLDPAVK